MEGTPGRASSTYKACRSRGNTEHAGTARISVCLEHEARWALARDDVELLGREQTRIASSLTIGMN